MWQKKPWESLYFGFKFWLLMENSTSHTLQKNLIFFKDFLSKYSQICSFLWIWSHLLKKSLMKNLIFLCHDIFKCEMFWLRFLATEIVWNGIEKVNITSFGNVEIGEIDSVIIGNHVYVSIARPPKSGCGDGYILKCTFSMECTLLQTILTNSPKIEFFEYNTSSGVSNVSMFVGHWKQGKFK